MGAHRFLRFTKFELELRDAASKTLASDTASIAEKRHARRVLHDTLAEAQGRHVMAKVRRALGPKPTKPGPELDAWRDALKRIKAEAVLDDTRSSLAQTRLAERTLKEVEVRERQRGTVPATRKRETADPAPRTIADDGLSPDVQKFFDGLAEKGEPDVTTRSDDTSSLRPAPQAAQLYCEKHACPIEICGCNTICPECLLERRICGHRKEEKNERGHTE